MLTENKHEPNSGIIPDVEETHTIFPFDYFKNGELKLHNWKILLTLIFITI